MSIKSSPFSATILSGEEARKFLEQLDEPPNAAAKASLERGRELLESAQWAVRTDREGVFMFTASATQAEALAKFNTAKVGRRVLSDPRGVLDFVQVMVITSGCGNPERGEL